MAGPKWTRTIKDQTVLPINLHMTKAYVMANVEYNATHWTRVYNINGEHVVARVRQKIPLSKDITIKMEANVELSEKEQSDVREIVRYEIGADEDLEVLKKVQEEDILTKIALKNSAGLRLYASANTVETAICTIIQQNVDLANFQYIVRDLVTQYGEKIPWDKNLYAFPSNERIAEMDFQDWDELGLGLKSGYLANLSKRELKDFHIYAYYPVYDRGIEGLKHIDGVGDYTARLIMIYAARRYDKAIIDGYVQEILDHKYKLHQVLPLTQYDKWIAKLWPEDPALVLHAHIQDYLPAYVKDFDFKKLYKKTN